MNLELLFSQCSVAYRQVLHDICATSRPFSSSESYYSLTQCKSMEEYLHGRGISTAYRSICVWYLIDFGNPHGRKTSLL